MADMPMFRLLRKQQPFGQSNSSQKNKLVNYGNLKQTLACYVKISSCGCCFSLKSCYNIVLAGLNQGMLCLTCWWGWGRPGESSECPQPLSSWGSWATWCDIAFLNGCPHALPRLSMTGHRSPFPQAVPRWGHIQPPPVAVLRQAPTPLHQGCFTMMMNLTNAIPVIDPANSSLRVT